VARKPEAALPMMPSTKQEDLPRGYVKCSAAEHCRKPGRLPFEGYNGLICVDHYYAALEESRKHAQHQ
jgi:hypothetical protein